MSSSVKSILEESVKNTVTNFCGGFSHQLSGWLKENKEIEISPEELCQAFEIPYQPSTPGSYPNGSSVQTKMPNMPNYYAGTGATTPKRKGGRSKKTVDPNLPTCSYVLVRGKNSGAKCPNPVSGEDIKGGNEYCKQCLKKAAVKTALEEGTSKPTVQPPQMPGSVVDIPTNVPEKNDELQVVEIPGEPGLYREVTYGFIVQPNSEDGSITALSIDDNGTRRDLRENERNIALKLGINVVNSDSVPVPKTPPTATTTAQATVLKTLTVPTVPQIPTQVPTQNA